MSGAYMNSMYTQIEKQFNIPASLVGIINGSFEIGNLSFWYSWLFESAMLVWACLSDPHLLSVTLCDNSGQPCHCFELICDHVMPWKLTGPLEWANWGLKTASANFCTITIYDRETYKTELVYEMFSSEIFNTQNKPTLETLFEFKVIFRILQIL